MTDARIIGYYWKVNAEHPRLLDKRYSGGGDRVTLGQRGPTFLGPPPPTNPWGLDQIWIARNGQEFRAKWKPHS